MTRLQLIGASATPMTRLQLIGAALALFVLTCAVSTLVGYSRGNTAGVLSQAQALADANAEAAQLRTQLAAVDAAYVEAKRLRDQYKADGARAEQRLGDALQQAAKSANDYAQLLQKSKAEPECAALKERLCKAVLPY